MLKYMSYLFANIRKKWSTYLIPLFGALTFIGVLLPLILSNETDQPVIGNILVFFYFLPFVFGAMFVGVKALNIFKDGEDDGTELLIVSKPISRKQIVIGKFLTLYLLIFIYALWSFFTTLLVGLADTHATTSAIFNFAGGFGLGSLIIMIFFSAIITFFASIMGKIGTMALSIVVPALLPIVSFILVPIGKGTLSYDISGQMQENEVIKTHVDPNQNVTIHDVQYIYDSENAQYSKALKDKQDGFYKNVSYFDVWQHMFGFYSVLESQKLNLRSQGVKLVQSKMALTEDDGIVIDAINNKKYLITINGLEDEKNVGLILTQLLHLAIKEKITIGDDFDVATEHVDNVLMNLPETKDILNQSGSDYNAKNVASISFKFIAAYLGDAQSVTFTKGLDTIISSENQQAQVKAFELKTNSNGKLEATFDTLEIEKYQDTGTVIGIYSALAILLSGLVIFRYFKRDFK